MHNAIAYLDGQFQPLAETRVSVQDRGFLLGDGVYEVIPVYAGRPFLLDEHLTRLDRSLELARIRNPYSPEGWREMLQELIRRNGGGDQGLYFQVTRGAAPSRAHAFPANASPSVFASSQPLLDRGETPARAITHPDTRWSLCHMKSISLMGNLLLRQAAVDADCLEAILLRDAQVTEGAASNVFVVRDSTVFTPPASHFLLEGITRGLVIGLCREARIPIRLDPIPEPHLRAAQEVWLTTSLMGVVPVTVLDEQPVGTGLPGPLWRRVWELWRERRERWAAG